MKLNFLWSALLTLASFSLAGAYTINHTPETMSFSGGGTVVVEGQNLTATSDDLEDKILEIILVSGSGNVHVIKGCNLSSCSGTVSHLSPGSYDATVISTSGGFNDTVFIR